MKFRNWHILLFLLFAFQSLQAQKAIENQYWARNSFFFELGGQAWIFSLNYERRLVINQWLKAGIRAGFGVNMLEEPPEFMYGGNLLFPFSLCAQVGKDENHVEVATGVTIQGNSSFNFGKYNYPSLDGKPNYMGTLYIGFRHHPPMGGVLFRAGYSPMYTYLNETDSPPGGKTFHHWAGISIGYSLKNANIK